MKDSHYQTLAKKHLENWKVGALFMEPGTGKTKVAIDIVNGSPCDVVLWIAPLQTIKTGNIANEVAKQGGFRMPAIYVGVESLGASDRIFLSTMETLSRYKQPFIVVDESLKIKNYAAKRTLRVLRLGELANYKLILNGTPISRDLLDMWSQMQFLSPLILNMSLAKFKRLFCTTTVVSKRDMYGREHRKEFITGYANVDYLYSLIRHYIFKAELTLGIDQHYRTRYYSITGEEREAYEEIKQTMLSDEMLEFRNNNIFIEMTQKMQHTYSCSPQKIDMVKDILKDEDPAKTIIFCKYIDSAELCKKMFPGCLVLTFMKDSMGLNLQQYNCTIYFDKTWDYATMTQSERRTFRTGQDSDCVYYNLTACIGLDHLIDGNISKKISMAEYFKHATKQDLEQAL